MFGGCDGMFGDTQRGRDANCEGSLSRGVSVTRDGTAVAAAPVRSEQRAAAAGLNLG
jgi:hypothetical protein